jgi:hypothetical protein
MVRTLNSQKLVSGFINVNEKKLATPFPWVDCKHQFSISGIVDDPVVSCQPQAP